VKQGKAIVCSAQRQAATGAANSNDDEHSGADVVDCAAGGVILLAPQDSGDHGVSAMRTWLSFSMVIAMLAYLAWADDTITLKGERTVYTVDCRQGTWIGQHCSGQLLAGARYRFKALKARREVLFWTSGVAEPSARFTNCEIQDGRNWRCDPTPDMARTVTREMLHGSPVAHASGLARPLHAVAKWKWYFLSWGIPVGQDANQ
jgi:hypothetical protein